MALGALVPITVTRLLGVVGKRAVPSTAAKAKTFVATKWRPLLVLAVIVSGVAIGGGLILWNSRPPVEAPLEDVALTLESSTDPVALDY
jgi:hypothetical protein